MFDFDPRKKKSQDAVSSAMRGDSKSRSVQDRMPIADVEGPFLRLKDGATCVYMTYPGTNLSLLTRAQRQDWALANGQVLAALQCDSAGIWLLPERLSAETNVELADRAAERLARTVRGGAGTREDRIALELLELSIRPSLSGRLSDAETIAWRTYLGLRFDRASDHDVMTAANVTAKMLADRTGKRPVILTESAILDFIDLYFRGWSPENRSIGTRVVMPDLM